MAAYGSATTRSVTKALTAATVDTVTLSSGGQVIVHNMGAVTDRITVVFARGATPADPTADADNAYVVQGTNCRCIDTTGSHTASLVLKLISAGTPTYHIEVR